MAGRHGAERSAAWLAHQSGECLGPLQTPCAPPEKSAKLVKYLHFSSIVVRGDPRPAATVWYQMSTKISSPRTSVYAALLRAQRERRTIEARLGDGLELRAGARKAAFSLKFRDRRTGRQERLTLGYYPAIGLAEARRRAKEEQARIADPKVLANPVRERRDVSSMSTFKELAELKLADENLADTTRAYYRWCFELNKVEQPLFVPLERPATMARAGFRLDTAGIGPALDPTDRSRGADIE